MMLDKREKFGRHEEILLMMEVSCIIAVNADSDPGSVEFLVIDDR
jgi:hypothetical protein